MIGKKISHYKILEKIGGGGMGVVYKAHDEKLDRPVALKFLPPSVSINDEAKQRLINEARAASALDHANICTIYEIDETPEGQLFIAMAYYSGTTLKHLIEAGKLDNDEINDLAVQIVKGLVKAHDKEIVHRDIKPANIFITNEGEVKILDFGLAKAKDQTEITKKDSTSGTIAYMSPEQTAGEIVDHRTDIWSLGVVLYEMLTGEKPFKGDFEQAVIYSILNEEPESISSFNRNIKPEIEKIVHKCLNKNKKDRYQSMDELLSDLSSYAGIPYNGSLPESLKRLWRRKKVRRMSAIISSFILISFVMIFFWPKIDRPLPVAVISFENHTGDKKYDLLSSKVIPNLLITNLEQSGRFRVIPWDRLYDIVEQLGRERTEIINNDLGFDICRFDDVPNIIVGSFAKSGDIFVTDLKVLDVDTKEILQTAQAKGTGENSILETQIDELIREVFTDFGEITEAEYADTKLPLIDVTTNSIDAYKYYVQGREYNQRELTEEARKYYVKAIETDSTFAMAYLYLAMTYRPSFKRNIMMRDKYAEKAYRYRHKVTYKERIILDYLYAVMKFEDASERVSELKIALKLYPREKQLYYILAEHYRSIEKYDSAIIYYDKVLELNPKHKKALTQIGYTYVRRLKNYSKGIEYFQRYAEAAPDEFNPYDCLAETYLNMNECEKSIEMYEKVLSINPSLAWPHYNIAQNYIKMQKYQKARDRLSLRLNLENDPNITWGIRFWVLVSYVGEENYKLALREIEIMDSLSIHESDTGRLVLNKFHKMAVLSEMGELETVDQELTETEKLMGTIDGVEAYWFYNDIYLVLLRHSLARGNIEQAKDFLKSYKERVRKTRDPGRVSFSERALGYSGVISYHEGMYEKAISLIEQSNLGNPIHEFYLAQAYLKIGNKKKSMEKFEGLVNYMGPVTLNKEFMRCRAKKQLSALRVSNPDN